MSMRFVAMRFSPLIHRQNPAWPEREVEGSDRWPTFSFEKPGDEPLAPRSDRGRIHPAPDSCSPWRSATNCQAATGESLPPTVKAGNCYIGDGPSRHAIDKFSAQKTTSCAAIESAGKWNGPLRDWKPLAICGPSGGTRSVRRLKRKTMR